MPCWWRRLYLKSHHFEMLCVTAKHINAEYLLQPVLWPSPTLLTQLKSMLFLLFTTPPPPSYQVISHFCSTSFNTSQTSHTICGNQQRVTPQFNIIFLNLQLTCFWHLLLSTSFCQEIQKLNLITSICCWIVCFYDLWPCHLRLKRWWWSYFSVENNWFKGIVFTNLHKGIHLMFLASFQPFHLLLTRGTLVQMIDSWPASKAG